MTGFDTTSVAKSPPTRTTPSRKVFTVLRDPLLAFSLLWLGVVVLLVAFGPHLAPRSASSVSLPDRLIAPFESSQGRFYILGTDELGRDYLSVLMVGARNSVLIGVVSALAATLVAVILGSVAGYVGGRTDKVISRLIELQLGFPGLLFALLILVSVGPSPLAVIVVIAVGAWASIARYVRGLALEIRELAFIDAARAMGASPLRIICRHVVPNLLTEVAVLTTLRMASLMLAAAGLDFLGLGLQPPATSWGILIANGRNFVQSAWWLTALPGIAIFLTALAINVVALWLRNLLGAEGRALAFSPRQNTRAGLRRALRHWRPSAASGGRASDSSMGTTAGDLEEAADVLTVEGLAVDFYSADGVGHAVRGVSWHIGRGEMLAIVGESGSGKSATVQAIMDVLPRPQAQLVGGSIRLNGVELTSRSPRARRAIAGDKIAMIPQDAISALDPSMTVGAQMVETMTAHQKDLSKRDASARALELFRQVGIPDPETRLGQYPHQFSGGMCQRVLIAMAISNRPTLLIADEPTTALDVTVQNSIMELLVRLKRELKMSVVLVTHDLALVEERADRVIVMYAGRVMESGEVQVVVSDPLNPYTDCLLEATPRMENSGEPLIPIRGKPPTASNLPTGCAFRTRCPQAADVCAESDPPLKFVSHGRGSACHFSGVRVR